MTGTLCLSLAATSWRYKRGRRVAWTGGTAQSQKEKFVIEQK